ncbi:regulator of chromosome condensation 1/beta-lactamase-inhibitor protein II [Myxozyma melibiosi]|uniref:Regulator of chromosome condensation 1/beta-lactamase-inhibitor protein II n=1 Tax=Myxozyma melibiosi TaxID=54550 RepID=A0ABR1FBW9_9ASCO
MALLSFGSNSCCQLSHVSAEDLYLPTRVPVRELPLSKTTEIRSNGNHTLLFDRSTNQLFAAGDNAAGQCCVGPEFGASCLSVFKEVQPSVFDPQENWIPEYVAAGWEFSVIVATHRETCEQAIFVAGAGSKGELALGSDMRSAPVPVRVDAAELLDGGRRRIVQISAGLAHVVVLLDDFSVWGWGSCRKGQLGSANSALKCAYVPVRVVDGERLSDWFRPVKVVCGREFTGLIDAEGRVVVLMDNLSKNSDRHGIVRDVPPAKQVGSDWKDFQCGWSTLHVLLGTGQILSWGNNSHMQHAPADAPEAELMACGSEHTLVYSRREGVFAWGWGEHGNCGDSVDRASGDVNVGRAAKVYEGDVGFLGAGCATSWIGVGV